MKNLLFGLIATVLFAFNGNANNINSNESKFNCNHENFENPNLKKRWIKILTAAIAAAVSIDIDFGQNKVINGIRHSCIGGGVCHIGVNNKLGNTKLNELKAEMSYLIVDEKGVTALLIPKEIAKNNKEFDLNEGVYFSENDFSINEVDSKEDLGEFNNFILKAGNKYNLEELDNHISIIF